MSVGQAIRQILKESNKSSSDLANQLGIKEKTIIETLSRGKIDNKIVNALKILTGKTELEISKRVEDAKREEINKSSATIKVKELEEKIKQYIQTIETLEEKITEKSNYYEQVIASKDKIIADQEKVISHKDKIIEKNELLLQRILENTKKL